MTIELAVALPALVIVAVIAVNALSFFGQCAVFDRVAHEAVRVHAAAPAYGQGPDQSCALVKRAIEEALGDSNASVSVACGSAGFDFERYTATIDYAPTLFGMGLRSEVLGVSLPHLTHTTSCVIDTYKAGVII